MRTVDLSGDVHVQSQNVKGQSLDLVTQRAKIDGLKGQLTVPTTAEGDDRGRAVHRRTSLVYRPNSDYAKLTKVAFRQGQIRRKARACRTPGRRGSTGTSPAARRRRPNTDVNNVMEYTDARAEDGHGDRDGAACRAEHAKTDVLVATGRATYRSAKADFVADKIVVNRKDEASRCSPATS